MFFLFLHKQLHMKKTVFVLMVVLTAAFLTAMTTSDPLTAKTKSTVSPGASIEIPDSVMQIVRIACMDCHSDNGSAMARGKLNFSKWSSYDSDKQVSKAIKSCEEMGKASMPPKKWRAKKPDQVPTQAQVDLFCRWTKSLSK